MEILAKIISLIISFVTTAILVILSIKLTKYLYNLEDVSELLHFILVMISLNLTIVVICSFVPITCIMYLVNTAIIFHIIESIAYAYDWIKEKNNLAYSKTKNMINRIQHGYKHKRNKTRRI